MTGLRWMVRADAPLRFNLRPTWHKLSWMAEFIANIPDYRGNTIETVRLAIKARRALLEMADREGIDFDHQRRGVLHFYRSKKDLAQARMVNDMFAEGGLERRELSGDDIAALETALVGETAAGFFSESDSSGDAHKFTPGDRPPRSVSKLGGLGDWLESCMIEHEITGLRAPADRQLACGEAPISVIPEGDKGAFRVRSPSDRSPGFLLRCAQSVAQTPAGGEQDQR